MKVRTVNRPLLKKICLGVVIVCGALVGALSLAMLIGSSIENVGRHVEDHERCLAGAKDGAEIARCR